MSTAGYSGTPLWKKLGIKSGQQIWLKFAPPAYIDWLGIDISTQICTRSADADLVHLFATKWSIFETEMKKLQPVYTKKTTLVIWISWYKKSAGIATDITEDRIRAYALQHELVDIKVCAVNEQWSGLKLVVPLAKR